MDKCTKCKSTNIEVTTWGGDGKGYISVGYECRDCGNGFVIEHKEQQ